MGKSGRGAKDDGVSAKGKLAKNDSVANEQKPSEKLKSDTAGNKENASSKRKKASEIEDIFNAAKQKKASAPPAAAGKLAASPSGHGDKDASRRAKDSPCGTGGKAGKGDKAMKGASELDSVLPSGKGTGPTLAFRCFICETSVEHL
eukprot:jgi/Mesvir1/25369/Mv01413-RA.1